MHVCDEHLFRMHIYGQAYQGDILLSTTTMMVKRMRKTSVTKEEADSLFAVCDEIPIC